jgi:hypothetical protein
MGSENGHLVRCAQAARGDVVAYGSAGMYFLERAAALQRRLYATASTKTGSSTGCDPEFRFPMLPTGATPLATKRSRRG